MESGWKRSAAFFLASQNLSLFGSGVVGFGILWHITLETSSGSWMTLYTVCAMLPSALIAPWGGVFADRHNRKILIMLSDGFIALATLGLAIAFLFGFQRLELLLAASVVRSAGAGIQVPAVNSIFPQLVPKDALTRVQGINQSLNSVLFLLSPAVGGVVLGSLGIVWTFMVDVATATLAILVMARIRVGKIERKGESVSVMADLRRGLGYVRGHALLRRLILCFGASFFLFTPAAVLMPLMIERTFGGEVWRLTANELVWSLGSLLGGVLVSYRGAIHDKVRAIALCTVIFGVCFALLGVAWRFWIILALMGISGLFLPLVVTAQTVLIQEKAEPEMMGRVFSLVHIVTSLAMPVSIVLFGPLADIVSIQAILVVTGAACALVGVVYGRIGYGDSSAR